MMSSLDATDLFDVQSQLAPEELLVRDTVARFVDAAVLPIISRCFDEQRFPMELVPELASLGLLGCTIEGYGCARVTPVAYGLICEELERGDSAIRSFVSVQGSLAMGCIHAFGSEQQRQRWLPSMARGDAIGCFALTEAHGGSDAGNLQCRATLRNGDFVLRGSKMWITNGGIADVAVVWARTEQGVRAFLVEKGMQGFAAQEIERKLSLRASVTSALFFDDVRVPQENRLPGVEGLGGALERLGDGRYGVAWGAIGAARACFREALDYTASRVLFGRPLAHTQAMQLRLADMARRITTAQLLAFRLGRLKEAGRMQAVQASLAKWNNVRMALEVARDCRDILGASGIGTDHAAIRHMLNLESVITYEGAETVQQLVVGRELTGFAAF